MITEEKIKEWAARAGLIIAQHRWGHPEDPRLHELSQEIKEHLEAEPEVVPARKPMNGDELLEGFDAAECSGLRSFTEGVRWAEEFHGIGVNDE